MAEFIPNYTQNSPGANTAVLPQNNQVLDTYFKIQENKYRDKLFNYKKADDEARARAQALNFDTGEVWQQDRDLIQGKVQDMIDFVHGNPDAYDPKSDKYKEYDTKEREINFLINKSKHDKSIYDDWMNKGATDPNFQDDYEQIKGNLDKFKVTDINSREWTPVVPAPTFNLYDGWGAVSGNIETATQTKQGVDKGGNNLEFITEDVYDPEKRTQAIEMIWDNNIKRTAQHITRDYNSLPPDSPEKKMFTTARDYGIHIMDKTFPTVKKSTTAIKPRKFASSSGGNTKNDSGIEFIAQKANDLSNPNSDIYKKATVVTADGKKKEVAVTTTFSGLPVVIKDPKNGDNIETTIDAIYNIDGKLYAAPISNKTKTGSIAIKDMIPIDNIEDQVIVPYVNTEYGSSPNTAQLADNTLKLYRRLKGGKGNTNNTAPSKGQKYDTKTQSGINAFTQRTGLTIDDFEARVDKALKANPKATRQQIIDAIISK